MAPRRKSKAKDAFVRPEQTSALANLPHELLVGIIMDSVRDEDGAADDLFKLHDRLKPLMLCRSLAAAIGSVLDDSTVAIGQLQLEVRRRGVAHGDAGRRRAERTRKIAISASALRPGREATAKLLRLRPRLERLDLRHPERERFVLEEPLRGALLGLGAMTRFTYEGSPASPWLTLEDLLLLVAAFPGLEQLAVHAQIGTQRFASKPPSTVAIPGRQPLRRLSLGHRQDFAPVVLEVVESLCSATAADLQVLELVPGVGAAYRAQPFAELMKRHANGLQTLNIGAADGYVHGGLGAPAVNAFCDMLRPLAPRLATFELRDVVGDARNAVCAAARMTTGVARVHLRLETRKSDQSGPARVKSELRICDAVPIDLTELIVVWHQTGVRGASHRARAHMAVLRLAWLPGSRVDRRRGRGVLRRLAHQGHSSSAHQDAMIRR